LKTRFNFDPSKAHNYIWLRFYKKRFHIWLYNFILQPMFSHYNFFCSGIQYQFLKFLAISQLISPFFFPQKFIIHNTLFSKTNCANVFIIKFLV
jgi:hypothetical protein